METEAFLAIVREAIAATATGRFLETERGFQGQLLVELHKRVELPPQMIIEQEYQKRAISHGLTIRPDIIIHEPFDILRHVERNEGNLAVFELKLRASSTQAKEDYQNLAAMLRVLRYRVGIFVNIDSTETHIDQLPKDTRGQIVSYAVSRARGVIEDRSKV